MSAGAADLIRHSGVQPSVVTRSSFATLSIGTARPRRRGISVGNHQFTSCQPAFEFSGRPHEPPVGRGEAKPLLKARAFKIPGRQKIQPRPFMFPIVPAGSFSLARPHSPLASRIMARNVLHSRRSRKLSFASFAPALLSDG
jgi:hypothetical protein